MLKKFIAKWTKDKVMILSFLLLAAVARFSHSYLDALELVIVAIIYIGDVYRSVQVDELRGQLDKLRGVANTAEMKLNVVMRYWSVITPEERAEFERRLKEKEKNGGN